jgi:hypothetical protein
MRQFWYCGRLNTAVDFPAGVPKSMGLVSIASALFSSAWR